MREFLNAEGFLEVDTPVLEQTPGGAEAEPFVTHHNALDEDFYLRISLEISLKKIIVGGFEKVYEIGKVFRNEGIDAEHLQDYLQMEFYWAYADYRDLMTFLPKMYRHIVKKTTGSLVTEWNGKKIYWGKPWKKIDYVQSFKRHTKLDPIAAPLTALRAHAKKLGLAVDASLERGRLVDMIYKKTVRPTLIQPCFLLNPPVFLEPLAKRSPDNPEVVERLQVVACGSELGKGFSEGNDPQDQRERFEQQMALREKGDKEAQMLDEDFLEALEYGMPPTAGFGLSERLFAMIMDKPIRETVFFPPMKRVSTCLPAGRRISKHETRKRNRKQNN
jgi:lysyl-tRNA synthetase class 2